MDKKVLLNGILKRLDSECELRPSEVSILLSYIKECEIKQRRIDDAIRMIDIWLESTRQDYSFHSNPIYINEIRTLKHLLKGDTLKVKIDRNFDVKKIDTFEAMNIEAVQEHLLRQMRHTSFGLDIGLGRDATSAHVIGGRNE